MSKKIKLNSNLLLFIGLVFIILGLFILSSEYFQSKKDKAFAKMNIMLYENEMPENIIEPVDETEDIENPLDDESNVENPEESAQTSPAPANYFGVLEIPKIKLKRGFYDLDSPYNNVDKNVVVIRGSTFPDEENNNLILAGHSGNCWYCYFNKLYKLDIGDDAYLTYNGNVYEYEIVNIYEVEKTGSVAIYRNYKKSTLTLITCTRNSKTKQTVYILELQN